MVTGDETVRLEVVGDDDLHGSKSSSAGPLGSGELAALESRLESAEGVSGLATWLGEVEAMVSEIDTQEIGETRNEIREVIDKLLQINAEVQNLLRLKKLLS